MSNDISLKGGRELQAFLNSLPAKMEASIMRAALRAGAKVVLEDAKERLTANGSVDSAKLRDSLRVSTRSRRGQVSATIKTSVYYARFVEFGTQQHEIKPRRRKSLFLAGVAREAVKHPGAGDKPFMRPALDTSAPQALAAVGDAIRKRLTKQGLEAGGLEVDDE